MRKASKILSVLLALFFIWNIFIYFTNKNTVAYVTHGSISDTISCEGQIIKDEVLVKAPADGVLQPYLTDCEKAGKGNCVAAILNGETNEAARKKLTVLKSRISSLEDVLKNKNFEEDVVSIDSVVTDTINKVIAYSAGNKTTKVSEYKETIIKQLDRRNAIENSDGSELLTKLKNEQKQLEASLGNLINEINTPVSGVFSAKLDGLEGKYGSDSIEKLKHSDLETIKNTKPSKIGKVSKGDNVFKIINNFEWYVAVSLSKEQLGEMKEGESVKISFRDADSETVSARVEKILDEENGKRITVFKINKDVDSILSRRNVSIDIIRRTYTGFKIPLGALKFENGKAGVYVVNGSSRVFKEIEVVYHNENYLIAKENSKVANPLLLYDNVEVNGDIK